VHLIIVPVKLSTTGVLSFTNMAVILFVAQVLLFVFVKLRLLLERSSAGIAGERLDSSMKSEMVF